jgi:hypothetical protein
MGTQVDCKTIVKRGPGDAARGEEKQIKQKWVVVRAVVG